MENSTHQSFHLAGVQKTLLIPLWARAKECEKRRPVLVDRRAADILSALGCDTSQMDKAFDELYQLSWAIRAKMYDEEIKALLAQWPEATIVNIGAGLDTTFERVDNGRVRWYDLDLPEVIELRKRLVPETERSTCISKSVFDLSWFQEIAQPAGRVLLLACGVLPYFAGRQVKTLLGNLAAGFPEGEMVFDAPSRPILWLSNWSVILRGGMGAGSLMKWGTSSAKELAKWDPRIHVVDTYTWFGRIEMDESWSKETVKQMRQSNRIKGLNIFHLRFAALGC